jgi:alpha-galactosidase/6-phospho-beta-glucosidase family protein
MSLPSKEEIEEAARKLFMEERAKKGLPPVTPTEQELKEGSYWERARKALMLSKEAEELSKQRKYIEELAATLGLRVIPEEQLEKMLKPTEEAAKLKAEIERLRKEAEEAKRIAEEERRKAEEERKKAEEIIKKVKAEIPPLPIAPPPAPPPPTARRRERMVISPECNEIFKSLWKEVEKAASMNVGIAILGDRRGGAGLIKKALSRATLETSIKIESLANQLLECECELRMPVEVVK